MDGKELYKICEAFYLKMNKKENNIMRNALTQLTGSLTVDQGFFDPFSMDFGCITPLYVYRMLGGSVSIEKIEQVMSNINMYDVK